jgi:hypothetical protein
MAERPLKTGKMEELLQAAAEADEPLQREKKVEQVEME